jgi:hypothetical protein
VNLNKLVMIGVSFGFTAALLGAFIVMTSCHASADLISTGDAYSARNFHDPDVPIPLTDPLPFPWGTIEGIWQAQVAGHQTLFSFEVQSDSGSRKVLKVYEISSDTGEVVAQGTALSAEGSDEVRAGMVGQSGGYLLFVGLFEDKSTIGGSKRITVLRTRGFHESSSGSEQNLVIRKVSEAPIRAPTR